MHTFEVSDVAPAIQPLAKTSTRDRILQIRFGAHEAAMTNVDELVACATHGVVEAAHLAFTQHYPLVMSPDDIWLCIAQGFAAHVEANAEVLRSRFVKHSGKLKISIRRDDLVLHDPANDWSGCIAELTERVAEHIGKKRDLVVADFSTTGPVERTASEVVLLAAMKHYFEYEVMTLCGIPRVTLLGTPDDWRAIRRRALVLREFDLGWWIDALEPMLDEFVAASEGNPNIEHWRSLYSWQSRSGGDSVTGWINTLFPYLANGPNPVVATWKTCSYRESPGLAAFATGLTIAPFTWQYLGTSIAMELVAGFVGVAQDPSDLRVRPAIGWAVRETPTAAGARPPPDDLERDEPDERDERNPRILFRDGQGVEGQLLLADVEILIGRSLACSIRTQDAAVSRTHARIVSTDDGYVLEDLDSNAGTYVNDTPVHRHLLADGDVVRCGTLYLRFLDR